MSTSTGDSNVPIPRIGKTADFVEGVTAADPAHLPQSTRRVPGVFISRSAKDIEIVREVKTALSSVSVNSFLFEDSYTGLFPISIPEIIDESDFFLLIWSGQEKRPRASPANTEWARWEWSTAQTSYCITKGHKLPRKKHVKKED